MPATPIFYDVGTTDAVTEEAFGTISEGTTSAAWDIDLYNSGDEALTEVQIGVLESDDNGTTWHDDGELTAQKWVQVQAYGSAGTGIVDQVTSYVPLGVGARISLKQIPASTRRKLHVRVKVPNGATSDAKKFKLVVFHSEGVQPLSQGLYAAGIHGVSAPTGDRDVTVLLSGGEVTATGTPDNDIQIADLLAKVAGVPSVRYAAAETITASAGGKERWVNVSWDGSAINQTASSEVTAPAPETDKPATPAGEKHLGYVQRGDSTIVTGDIDTGDVTREPFFLAYSASSLDVTVGPGTALCDDRLLWFETNQTVTLQAASTQRIYLLPGRTLEAVGDGTAPSDAHAEPLWETTTDGSGVTAVRDLRRFLGPPRLTFEAHFHGTLVLNDEVFWSMPQDRGGYVRLPLGCSAGCDLSASDDTADSVDYDLLMDTGGGFASLFSAAAQKPQIEFNDADGVVHGAIPDTVAIPAGARLKWKVIGLTSGGSTRPADGWARVEIEEDPE